jgi:lipoate-protein ligase A
MAVDEALLATRADDDPPVLRLYGWSPAAVSLGRFQPAGDVTAPDGADLVRRATGGSALFHQPDEVTYAVVAPYALLGRRPRAAYRAIHGALAAALGRLGVDREALVGGVACAPRRGMCFDHATPEDLTLAGRKLLGSAQRRAGRAFLQHGALPCSADPLSTGAVGLAELLGDPPSREAIHAAVEAAFACELGAELVVEELTATERAAAERLEAERYLEPEWTAGGQLT